MVVFGIEITLLSPIKLPAPNLAMTRPCLLAAALVLSLFGGTALAQDAAPAVAKHVHGSITHPHPDHLRFGGLLPDTRLDDAALQAMPRTSVQASDHGSPTTWEGVALATLLGELGADLGAAQRGAQLRRYVLVEGSDGYRVVFSMGELDPSFGNTTVLLAVRRDGAPLDAEIGPWRMVVPGDTRQGRWIRNIVSIRLLQAD